jgi:hypothetical protein
MPLGPIEYPGVRLPSFELPTRDHSGSDSYRLRDGRVEFRPAGGHWRRLTDLDVKLHFTLDTQVECSLVP